MAESGSSSSDSPSGPPPKKLKERKTLDPAKMRGGTPDPDSDEEYYCPERVTNMDRKLWNKYIQQIDDSEGFDIVDYPGDCYMATVIPVDLQKSTGEARTLIELSTLAIQEYNEQNRRTKYEFVKVEKANASACAGIVYDITFQAKERKRRNPAVKTFQARVWQKIPQTNKEVDFCRLKKTPANSEDKVASELAA